MTSQFGDYGFMTFGLYCVWLQGNPVRFDDDGIRQIDSLTVYHYFPPRTGTAYSISIT